MVFYYYMVIFRYHMVVFRLYDAKRVFVLFYYIFYFPMEEPIQPYSDTLKIVIIVLPIIENERFPGKSIIVA